MAARAIMAERGEAWRTGVGVGLRERNGRERVGFNEREERDGRERVGFR